ncbi:MAG: thiamine phosphate synthase [Campylobacterota bacterium]|nr:thiamine phosphate synthase [Campylobacterota bacterium]
MGQFKGLYALCDYQTLEKKNISLSTFLDLLKTHKTYFIQYRDKSNPLDIQKQNIRFLQQNCDVPIIINDHYELLEIADGLHLGQEDCLELQHLHGFDNFKQTVQNIRKEFPKKILGLSTHNVQEIDITNGLDIDYIGLGAYRATNTKDISQILGDEIITIAQHSKHPVGAIGGVRLEDRIQNIAYNVIGSALYDD